MAIRTKIYLINATGTGRFKVGQARDVAIRLQALNCGSPFPLDLVYAVQVRNTDAYRIEFRLHQVLRQYQVRGEWFKLPKKLSTPDALKRLVADARQWIEQNPNVRTGGLSGVSSTAWRESKEARAICSQIAKSERIAADMRMRATYLPDMSVKSRFCDMGRSGFDLAPCV